MGIRRNKTILEQAADYVEAAVETAREKAGPAIADADRQGRPMLADAKDKAGPALADARDKAAPARWPRGVAAAGAPRRPARPTWRRRRSPSCQAEITGRAEEEAQPSASS